jgi:hypothetical protein
VHRLAGVGAALLVGTAVLLAPASSAATTQRYSLLGDIVTIKRGLVTTIVGLKVRGGSAGSIVDARPLTAIQGRRIRLVVNLRTRIIKAGAGFVTARRLAKRDSIVAYADGPRRPRVGATYTARTIIVSAKSG